MKNLRSITLGIYLLMIALGDGLAQEFWQQTKGPYGGYVGSLFTIDSNIILAGTRSGVFRSEDGGLIWSLVLPRNSCCFVPPDSFATPLFFLLPRDLLLEQASYVVDFAMDSRGNVYAATFDDWLYKSTDKGKTWTGIFFDLASIDDEAYTTVIAVNHNDQVFLGTQGGIVRSNDYGLTWEAIQTGLPDSAIVKALAVDNNNQIWAGLGGGKILRSASPEYFNLSSKENFRQKPKRFLQDPISIDQKIVNFESFNGFSPSYGLYKLPADGNRWQMAVSGEITGAVKSLIINNTGTIYFGTEKRQLFRYRENPFSLSRIGFDLANLEIAVPALASNSLGHVVVSFYGYGLVRSTNDGASWESIHSNEAAYEISALSVNNSNHLFAGSPRGVFRSLDNGQSLQTVNRGLLSTDVWAIAFNNNGVVLAGTLENGFFLSRDKGQNWVDLSENLEVPWVRDLAYNKKTGEFFAATSWGVLRTNRELTDAEEKNNGLTDLNAWAIAINDSGYIFVTTDPGGVFRSKDNGESWKPINIGLTNTSLFSIAINQSGHLFVGLSRSTNNGDSWRELNPAISDEVTSIAINKQEHIFASAFLDGIYRSINNGGNWQETGYFGIVPPIQSLTISNNDDIYAGSWWYGVYVSKDNGEKWERIVDGLPEITWIRELANDKDGFLYAGTNSFGIYRSRGPVTSVKNIADGTLLPKSTTLFQNYPNPFNPITTIRYGLPKAERVTLKIYNLIGEEVVMLLNDEHQAAGYHVAIWDGRNKLGEIVGSGVYIYRFRAGSFTSIKKMALVK